MLLRRRSARLLLLVLLVTFCFPASTTAQQPGPQPSTFLPFLAQNLELTFRWGQLEPVVLYPTPTNMYPMYMHVDQTRRVHLIWSTFPSPQLIYHTYSNANGWKAPAEIAPTLGSSHLLFPPFEDADGKLHLLWQNWLGISQELPYRLMYAGFNGEVWGPEEAVFQTRDSMVKGRLHTSSDGSIAITYLDDNLIRSKIYQIRKSPEGWTSPIQIKPSFSASQVWPDQSGGVHIFGDLYYGIQHVYWKDGQIFGEKSLNNGHLFSRQTQLDGEHNLHTFWEADVPVPGGTVRGVYHQCLDRNIEWGMQEIPSGQTAINGGVHQAFDGDNQFALSWMEADTNRMQISIWEGCQRKVKTSVVLPSDLDLELKAIAIRSSPDKICALFRQYFNFSGDYFILCGEPE